MSRASLRPETAGLTEEAVNRSSGPEREKSKRNQPHYTGGPQPVSHMLNIYMCSPHRLYSNWQRYNNASSVFAGG